MEILMTIFRALEREEFNLTTGNLISSLLQEIATTSLASN